ncbi:MAG: hypothetical protein D4R64_10905 [Porphyromonadaceae bacterium]|nr:MAG: hypothetical protein D4R64_10905 [Porphyromonadaceae bacterium]
MDKDIKRHEALITFLRQFELYKNTKIVEKERNTADLKNVDTQDINRAVFLICDFLNQPTGSSGDVDLYKLLQTYFTDIKKRKSINMIIDE